MFKFILLALCLLAFANSQSPALVDCLNLKCPDQYNKCKATIGCEDKLKKCATKCGDNGNQTCWFSCISTPGVAYNVAKCGVIQGCIPQ